MTNPAPDIVIRPQTADDAASVAAVIRAAFADEPGVDVLEADLARRDDSVGFVAMLGDRIVGHVRLTRGWVDAPQRLVEVVVLSPLSVVPDQQRRGIGRLLVAHAIEEAAAAGAPAVFLEGDPDYYSRLGWQPASIVGVTPPSTRIPEPACLVTVLAGHEPWMRGALVYPDTFWAHDAVGLREEDGSVT